MRLKENNRTGIAERLSRKRSRATTNALQRESRQAGSKLALSRHARSVARQKSASERSQAARKAARTRKKIMRRKT
jgi:hypothetical protein